METSRENDIVAKYLSGNASEREIKDLETWRQEPSNELAFKEIENIWKVSLIGKESFSPDTDQAWKKFRSMVQEEPASTFSVGRKTVYAISAAAAIIPFLIFIFFYQPNTNIVSDNVTIPVELNKIPALTDEVLFTEVVTGDSIQEFSLPDGSKVWLNKHSKFSYPEKFIDSERIVNLEGEAFFEVKKDDSQPFIIYTPTSVTKVTGTSFNLKAYPGKEVELYVVSGTVEFASLNKPEATKIALQPDEKASLNNKTDVTSKNITKGKDLTWKKGPKSPKKFRRFMNKIRQFFKKSEIEKQQ